MKNQSVQKDSDTENKDREQGFGDSPGQAQYKGLK